MATFVDDDFDAKGGVKQAATVEEDYAIDLGNEDFLKREGLEKIIPSDKGKVVRAALLIDVTGIRHNYIHFINNGDKKGSFRCLTRRDKVTRKVVGELADCCKVLNSDKEQAVQLVFAVLALQYTNASPKDGKYKPNPDGSSPDIEWSLGWVKLSPAGYKSLSKLVLEGEKSTDFDFIISYRETGIGFSYDRVSKTCLFRRIPELHAEVMEAAAQYKDGAELQNRIGRAVSLLEMKAMLPRTSATAKLESIDDTAALG